MDRSSISVISMYSYLHVLRLNFYQCLIFIDLIEQTSVFSVLFFFFLQFVAEILQMLVSLCKMTNTSVQKISKSALVQNVAFVISFWKVKE